jgi:hypothetical protein
VPDSAFGVPPIIHYDDEPLNLAADGHVQKIQVNMPVSA